MFSFFSKKPNRLLFRFYDGQTWRCEDPLLIRQRIDSHPDYRWDVHPAMAEKGDAKAFEIVLNAICEGFGVTRYDWQTKTGLTQAELLELLNKFAIYLDSIKKNIFFLPNSASSTESPT